jgi:TonB family protein
MGYIAAEDRLSRLDIRETASVILSQNPVFEYQARAVRMNNWIIAALAIVTLDVPVDNYAAQMTPVPDNPRQAQTFFGFNIKTRCPDLRIADAGTRAVIVFWVPQRGSQSQISLKTSSGSSELDSVALSCVSKLRFAPATTLGDGEPVDSWQQFALSWADPAKAYEARQPTAAAPAQIPVNARQDMSGGEGKTATVHVCVDEKGKLAQDPAIVQSSGVANLDQAAVKIAASGSAYYRPRNLASNPSTSGCVQLAITFDTK